MAIFLFTKTAKSEGKPCAGDEGTVLNRCPAFLGDLPSSFPFNVAEIDFSLPLW